MSAWGQSRRFDFCRPADFVAKVFLGSGTKILRAADAFSARRPEGPYRFHPKSITDLAVALKSDGAAEKSKNQLSRDFQGRSIFDFCNNICQNQTSFDHLVSAGEQSGWDFEIETLGGLQIDTQLVPLGSLNRKITR
jgi:hypothetical protein